MQFEILKRLEEEREAIEGTNTNTKIDTKTRIC